MKPAITSRPVVNDIKFSVIRLLIGRMIRRLRQERNLSPASLATRFVISASYLIEHNERPVTASLLIKLSRLPEVDLEAPAGNTEHNRMAELHEALTDLLLGHDIIGNEAFTVIAAYPVLSAVAPLTDLAAGGDRCSVARHGSGRDRG